MCASKYGHVAVVELLLKYNALIDLKDVVSLYHEFDAVRTVSHVNALLVPLHSLSIATLLFY